MKPTASPRQREKNGPVRETAATVDGRHAVHRRSTSESDQPAQRQHGTSALLDALVERQRATGKKIVAAEYAGVPGPPVLFHASLFAQLLELAGDEGARRVIKANPGEVERVPFPEGAMDVDTEADVARWQREKSASE